MNLDELNILREGNRLEAKAAQGGIPRSVWETVSAFANTSGGTILLGVKERGNGTLEAVGLDDAHRMLDDFWNAALSKDKLSARFMSDEDARIEAVDGKDIIVIEVPWVDRHLRPVFLDKDILDRTFRRTHTGDHHCSREEVQSMIRDASVASQDSEVIERCFMEDLDYDTVHRFRNGFLQGREDHAWKGYDDVDFLRALGAADFGQDGKVHPTGAGLLMFGTDRYITNGFPHYFLDYREETDPTNRWVDRFTSQPGDWSGNIYDFYYRVYNKLKHALKTPFKLDENMLRVDDTPAHKALREAIANCLTNANYYDRRGIVCVWRENAIVIENPGDFRMPIAEAMKPGKSDPRNETMLKIFGFVNVGERAGSGMTTIFDGWREAGYAEPFYDVEYGPDRTILTLPLVPESARNGHNPPETARNLPESGQNPPETAGNLPESGQNPPERPDVQSRSKNARTIYEYLGTVTEATAKTISASTGIAPRTVRDNIKRIKDEGLVVAVGSGKNTVYRIKR